MAVYSEPMKITSPTLHATIWFTMLVFVVIIVLSFVFRVEVVARGEGRVVPISRVQVVQPEFSGPITAINVRNGSAVAQGDVLIELDQTEALAHWGTIRAETERLQIEMARIEANVGALRLDMTDPNFAETALALFEIPLELEAHQFTTEQRRLFEAQIDDLLASFAQIQARETANLRSEDITNANIARVSAALDIQTERFAITERLLEQGTASRTSFLDAQQALAELERERDVYLRELDQKIAQGATLFQERRRIVTELRSNFLDRRAQIDSRLATLAQEADAAQRRIDAATLTAPASGIVDQLSVFTVGGIAEVGSELMRIVPTDVEVEIVGTFSNQDIGFMEIGQQVNISLDAYPSARFGFLKGNLSDISADSTEVTTGQWGFVVRVTPERPYLETGEEQFALRPGMTARIDVTTGERRIISYFFAPIVETLQDSMGER